VGTANLDREDYHDLEPRRSDGAPLERNADVQVVHTDALANHNWNLDPEEKANLLRRLTEGLD
jgi:hypothetical protein